ncbi:MAG: hypothetical protein KJZ85_16200 [Rhodobacteraceae bacterium]|nr:hypothetical protein [Paracoccaceae bacterium]
MAARRKLRAGIVGLAGAVGIALAAALAPSPAVAAEDEATRPGFFLFWATHPLRRTDVYQSDGTAEGTRLVFDTVPYDGPGADIEIVGLGPRTVAVVKSTDVRSRTRPGLYLLGQEDAPRRLGDRTLQSAYTVRLLGVFGGRLVVEVAVPYRGNLLYETDGTEAGTLARPDLATLATTALFEMAGRMFLLSNEYIQDRRGTEGRLYSVDLAAGRLTKLFDFASDGGSIRGYDPPTREHTAPVAVVGPATDRVVFWRQTSRTGMEPWVSDGTLAGTRLLSNIGPLNRDGTFDPRFLPFGDKALFIGLTDRHGDEPWITDGTPEGTVMLADTLPGASSSSGVRFDQMVELDGRVYFPAATTDPLTRGLWVTDGTPDGTRRIRLRHAGKDLSLDFDGPQALAATGGLLYFMGTKRSGDCPRGVPVTCRYDSALYRYDPASGRVRQEARTTGFACKFSNLHVDDGVFSGGSYGSLMPFGRGLLFPATGRPPVDPMPRCGVEPMDIEPWGLSGRTARNIVQINPRLESSNPVFIGSSLCTGRC